MAIIYLKVKLPAFFLTIITSQSSGSQVKSLLIPLKPQSTLVSNEHSQYSVLFIFIFL